MLTATRPASQYPRRAAAPSSPTGSGWKPDLLVVCVAIYIATAVGRLHEVFPVLGYFKPTLLSAAHGRHRAAGAHLLRGNGRVRRRRAVPLSAGGGELATRTAVLLRRQRSGDAHRDGASAGPEIGRAHV